MNTRPYYADNVRRVTLNGTNLLLYDKPGMVGWDEIAPAAALLAQVPLPAGGRVLVLEGGGGALAVSAALSGAAQVAQFDDSLLARRMAYQTFAANDAANALLLETLDEHTPPFDAALMLLPKGRTFARARMAAAHDALKLGGQLVIAGAKAAGAAAAESDLRALFGNAVTLATKAHQRMSAAARRNGEWLAQDDALWFGTHGLRLFSLPGVFSHGEVDAGTAMLLDTLDAAALHGQRVLDVGCGAGVIGCAAAHLGAQAVDMVDVSAAALDAAQRNAAGNGLLTCRAFYSDLYSDVDGTYDLILSNPPFHSGQGVDTNAAAELIRGARERLTPGGTLRLVANRFLPYDRLLREVFGACAVLREDGRFRVLSAG